MVSWKPVGGHIMTRWAEKISPDSVWSEYPRPQMMRDEEEWLNLNGLWDYAVVPRDQATVSRFQGQILVPFPIESALSGVKQPLLPDQRLWYRRSFSVPKTWRDQRVLLHFGAVDWEAVVWVNGQEAGVHRGGYDPFSFDISAYFQEGENELLVAVWDPTDTHWQSRGKQVLAPKTIWYTAVSGIWQTVWLEPVPHTYIDGLVLTPNLDEESLEVTVRVAGDLQGVAVEAVALDGGTAVASARGKPHVPFRLSIPNPRPWSPGDPHLYDLKVIASREGRPLDKVGAHFGMRKFSMAPDERGRMRLCLNNQPLFHYGPLDQGYWPDGLYTPPSDEAMRYDLEMCKQLGFNMIRKHIKVEPARYYHYCDRMGIIVWQDMPNGGKPVGGVLSFLTILFNLKRRDDRRYGRAGRQDPASRMAFREELRAMVDTLHNFACIGMWVPFNEAWGQFDANEIAAWLQEYDPTRPVDHASGWFDQGGGDLQSLHVYFKGLKPSNPEARRGVLLSEFGGYSLKIDGHVWDPDTEFGYRKFTTSEALTEAYIALLEEQLVPWIREGLSGAVYTQTTDVEIEINGYLTYDRAVVKMDAARIAAIHKRLYRE